jgi:hypothetical protein
MTAIWIGLLVTGSVVALVAWTTWRQRVQMADRGTVSQQWLSERRAQDHYSER